MLPPTMMPATSALLREVPSRHQCLKCRLQPAAGGGGDGVAAKVTPVAKAVTLTVTPSAAAACCSVACKAPTRRQSVCRCSCMPQVRTLDYFGASELLHEGSTSATSSEHKDRQVNALVYRSFSQVIYAPASSMHAWHGGAWNAGAPGT